MTHAGQRASVSLRSFPPTLTPAAEDQPMHNSPDTLPAAQLRGTADGLIRTTLLNRSTTLSLDPTTGLLTWSFLAADRELRLALEIPALAIVTASADADILRPVMGSRHYRSFPVPDGTDESLVEGTDAPNGCVLYAGAKLQMRSGTRISLPTPAALRIRNATPQRARRQDHMMHLTGRINDDARFDAKITFSQMLLALTTLQYLRGVALRCDGTAVVNVSRAMR